MHDSTFWLVNANQLDSDYNNSPWFKNSQNQLNWFRERTIRVLDNSMYHRKGDELNVVIYERLENLRNVNYLVVINTDGSKYFYFILNKEYNDMSTTTLTLQLDLIQTYMFDIRFTESLVEREHDYGWAFDSQIGKVPPPNIPENLEVGEYELKTIHNIYNYEDKGTYIIASSDMLGKSDDKRPGGDTPSPTPSGDNYKRGYLDEMGLVLLKHFEGFRAEAYQDSLGYWTIGYGVTQLYQPDYYNSLAPVCTEAQASLVMGELLPISFSNSVKNEIEAEFGTDWLNQNRFNALVSYKWQWGNLQDGGLWDILVQYQDDFEAIADAYYDLGVAQGYEYRRQKESEVFRSGDYSNIPIGTGSGVVTDNDGKGYIPDEYK